MTILPTYIAQHASTPVLLILLYVAATGFTIGVQVGYFKDRKDLYGSQLVNAHLAFTIIGTLTFALFSAVMWLWAAKYSESVNGRANRLTYGLCAVFLLRDLPLFCIEYTAILNEGWRDGYQGFAFIMTLLYFLLSGIYSWLNYLWLMSRYLNTVFGQGDTGGGLKTGAERLQVLRPASPTEANTWDRELLPPPPSMLRGGSSGSPYGINNSRSRPPSRSQSRVGSPMNESRADGYPPHHHSQRGGYPDSSDGHHDIVDMRGSGQRSAAFSPMSAASGGRGHYPQQQQQQHGQQHGGSSVYYSDAYSGGNASSSQYSPPALPHQSASRSPTRRGGNAYYAGGGEEAYQQYPNQSQQQQQQGQGQQYPPHDQQQQQYPQQYGQQQQMPPPSVAEQLAALKAQQANGGRSRSRRGSLGYDEGDGGYGGRYPSASATQPYGLPPSGGFGGDAFVGANGNNNGNGGYLPHQTLQRGGGGGGSFAPAPSPPLVSALRGGRRESPYRVGEGYDGGYSGNRGGGGQQQQYQPQARPLRPIRMDGTLSGPSSPTGSPRPLPFPQPQQNYGYGSYGGNGNGGGSAFVVDRYTIP